jgi:hypothetical protein
MVNGTLGLVSGSTVVEPFVNMPFDACTEIDETSVFFIVESTMLNASSVVVLGPLARAPRWRSRVKPPPAIPDTRGLGVPTVREGDEMDAATKTAASVFGQPRRHGVKSRIGARKRTSRG